MLWVHETATAPRTTRTEMHKVLEDWFTDAAGGFGLNGYAPGFLNEWWAARFEEGALEGDVDGQGRFTSVAGRADDVAPNRTDLSEACLACSIQQNNHNSPSAGQHASSPRSVLWGHGR